MLDLALVVIASYLLGAVPSGLAVGRLHSNTDLRQHGSGNIGFANAMRVLGLRAGLAVFIADLAKGVIAVLLARLALGTPVAEMAAGLAAVVGHNWSVYIRFQGGRGVSTGLGVLGAMSPLVTLASLAVFAATVARSRYISLGSILGAAATFCFMLPLAILGLQPWEYFVYALLAGLIIIFQHRSNIARLRAGTERRLGKRERGA